MAMGTSTSTLVCLSTMNRASATDHAPGRVGVSIGGDYAVISDDDARELAKELLAATDEETPTFDGESITKPGRE